MSNDHRDNSLFRFYSKYYNKGTVRKTREEILLNSYNSYEGLKSYVDKMVAHMDQDTVKFPEHFKLEDLQLIHKDIFTAFNKVTLHVEQTTFSDSYSSDVARTTKSFFTKFANAVINAKE